MVKESTNINFVWKYKMCSFDKVMITQFFYENLLVLDA